MFGCVSGCCVFGCYATDYVLSGGFRLVGGRIGFCLGELAVVS